MSAVDYDDDGRVDLFFPDGVDSRLFKNITDLTATPPVLPVFRDVTKEAGLEGIDQAHCALFCDIDNDGDRDLYRRSLSRARTALPQPAREPSIDATRGLWARTLSRPPRPRPSSTMTATAAPTFTWGTTGTPSMPRPTFPSTRPTASRTGSTTMSTVDDSRT